MPNKIFPNKNEDYEKAIERYISLITPKFGDTTYSILRSHLLFEELLRDFISTHFRSPNALEGARFTFAQVLAIARASAIFIEPDDWAWPALEQLNKLRNLLAHHIEAQKVDEKVKSLADFIVESFDRPVPKASYVHTEEGFHHVETNTTTAQQPQDAKYLKIDLALVGLYARLKIGFDLEKEQYKPRKATTNKKEQRKS